jgi:hypothetical protein
MNEIERPMSVGWYLAWLAQAAGEAHRASVIYCYPEDTGIYCECRDGKEPAFRPLTHDYFRGAKWRGPYASRREAEAALAAG